MDAQTRTFFLQKWFSEKKPSNCNFYVIVRQPLQSATPPHWETSPMAVRAIPGSTRRRIARRIPTRIQIVFGLAAVFYSTIGMGWQKMHKRVEAWKQKKIHINNMYKLHIFIQYGIYFLTWTSLNPYLHFN